MHKEGMPLAQGDIEFAASLFPADCPFFSLIMQLITMGQSTRQSSISEISISALCFS